MKNDKLTIKDAPYYYYEGKGWKIRQHYTHPELGRIQVEKQWFRTKSEAKANYQQVLEDAIAKAKKKQEMVKFPNKVYTWEAFRSAFAEDRLNEVRGNTWQSKDRPMMNKYFNPMFDGKPLEECFSEDMARRLKKAILSAKTKWGDDVPKQDKNRAITLYLKMLDFAYENDYCTDMDAYRHIKAIMKRVRVSDETGCGHKRPPKALTVQEVESLLSVIEFASPDYMVTKLLFHAGMRIGELLALYVSDIDFANKEVDMHHIMAPDSEGNLRRFARAKSANGIRKIPLSDDITNLLQIYIKENAVPRNGYLFPGIIQGKPMDRAAYARRLRKYCAKAGVEPINPHAARHTFCTVAHELGYPPEVISMVLGHTVMVDMTVYNHKGNMDKGREMVSKMFRSVGKA